VAAFDHRRYDWDAWSPEQASTLLAGVEAPWCVAAGWAIDLFLGGGLRAHEDLELAVPAARFPEVETALAGFELFVPSPDPAAPDDDQRGLATPLAEAGALLDSTQQTWVLDRAAERWRLDVFREPSDGETWLCRRDETIRLPYERVIERTPRGIPYAAPEIVLLFKAKHTRPKDEADFAATIPHLDAQRVGWLAAALERVHPGHRWLDELRGHPGFALS
jgi:hypothetical protein